MIEAALLRPSLLRPVVDLLLSRLDRRRRRRLRRCADAALRDAIRELLLAQPDERRVEARIAQARAAGAVARETALAEAMLARHRETRACTAGKLHRSRRLSRAA
jgi:hypothetical protein